MTQLDPEEEHSHSAQLTADLSAHPTTAGATQTPVSQTWAQASLLESECLLFSQVSSDSALLNA